MKIKTSKHNKTLVKSVVVNADNFITIKSTDMIDNLSMTIIKENKEATEYMTILIYIPNSENTDCFKTNNDLSYVFRCLNEYFFNKIEIIAY